MAGGPFGPGSSASITVEAEHSNSLKICLASMLANTNDAFTGVAAWDIGALSIGESQSILTRVYDAGTESNNEAAGTIPGPADGGEGFNSSREARNRVVIHPGVVTNDDGFTTSVLNETHRWLGPAAKVTVSRTQ